MGGGDGRRCMHKIAFWNVAGLRNKDEEFRKGLEEWDVIVMSETWMVEGGWGYIERRLPRGYVWFRQWPQRERKKGRAIGGMLTGVRKGLEVVEEGEGGREGIITKKVRLGEEWWRIVGVYVNGDLKKKLEDIGEWMEQREWGVRGLIGGFSMLGQGKKEGGYLDGRMLRVGGGE